MEISAHRDFLGGSQMGELIRAHDWSATLGAPAQWPRSLQTAVRIMLSSRHPMWVGWGPRQVYLYNDAYRAIIGGKHPWALGRTIDEVWPEIQDYIAPRLAQVLAGGEGIYVEGQLLIMERNGYPEETYYTFSFSPLPDDDGRPGGIICVNTDDTRRVIGDRQLATLREQAASTMHAHGWQDSCERSAAALAANAHDVPFAAIYVAEPDGAFVLAASDGTSAGESIAPRRILPGDERSWPLARALAAGHPLHMHDLSSRFRMQLPRGAWPLPPSQAVLLPIAPAGEHGRAAVLVVGLNPYRLYDAAYASFLELAAGQVGAAIAQADALEQERRRAQELARLDQAKTLFFSNVSHEFRTPLTLMLGPLEEWLAREETAPAASRSLVELAHRNGLRLLKLVNTLLDFARIEAGRAQARYEPTDLSALTAELASSFRSAIEKAGLMLTVACPAGLPPAYVDREMWEKVVLNLVSNAFKFTFEGGIVVTLSPQEGCLTLEVSDTGTGIPAEEMPRLFERFHRVEGARGRSIEGSGIGLALVRELVSLHGGQLEAVSAEGRGTTLTVRIPVGKAHLDAARVFESDSTPSPARHAAPYVDEAAQWLSASVAPAPYVPAPEGASGEYILLADDNQDMRQYVQRLLQEAGWRVACVADGEAALAAIRRERPSLLLADVMMPRLDGLALVQALRADPALALLPAVLLSARAGEEAKIEGIEAGADDYLVKPFTARELLVRVQSHVALAAMRREAAERERTLREQAEQTERRLRQRTGQLLDAQRDILQSREALRRLNATLEERVASEIAERAKTEEQLRQAQKMEAIGHLTGGIAHDFNNLLTVIIGNLELMQRQGAQGTPGHPHRYTDNAMLGARRAATLTQRLLAFARRQPLEPRPVDTNRLVLGMSDLLARTLGESIAIETVLANDLWQVNADGNQLESALLNLVVNARDAMPHGGRLRIETANVHIDADTAREEASQEAMPGAYARLSVTDTGAGMASDVRERVFEPFFTTKPTGHGTGLGLSQVYGFVRQSGGFVTLQSEAGHGTTVRIHLPRLTAEQAVTEPAAQPLPDVAGGHTVLVVEDNPDVRDYSCLLLRELGYQVLAAEDAPTALLLLAQHAEVDLLFTDVGLPGMNGRELAEQALALRPALKVLFVSGYARQAIVHQGRLDPGLQMLAKPFTHGELMEKLAAVMEVRQML